LAVAVGLVASGFVVVTLLVGGASGTLVAVVVELVLPVTETGFGITVC
jgi:hypothetical protein